MARGRLSERVKEMMKNFVPLHEEGFTIPEIAEKYSISDSTVYGHLDEIAEQNGYASRVDLLSRPRLHPTERLERADRIIRSKFEAVEQELEGAISSVENTIQAINTILTENEEKGE